MEEAQAVVLPKQSLETPASAMPCSSSDTDEHTASRNTIRGWLGQGSSCNHPIVNKHLVTGFTSHPHGMLVLLRLRCQPNLLHIQLQLDVGCADLFYVYLPPVRGCAFVRRGLHYVW